MSSVASFSHFSGRIVQVIQALDVGDAVSNQVVSFDRMLRSMFNLRTEIYAVGFHPERMSICKPIELMELEERDIVIYHFSGYAKESAAKVVSQKAVKILHYHNITPHEFFASDSPLYDLCKRGREQLAQLIEKFDFFTADSDYNIRELIGLGIPQGKTLVIPISVDTEPVRERKPQELKTNILFVGRIAENKRQDKLVEAYGRLLSNGRRLGNLVLVGNYDKDSQFYHYVTKVVERLGLRDRVYMTGKVSDQELKELYSRSSLYLSMSEHEGFGVPLLEACRYDIPVLALARAAVPETLRQSPGLFSDHNELGELIRRLDADPAFAERILTHQHWVLADHGATVRRQVTALLNVLIPQPDTFQTVSIVICTYNRADLLERALEYLEQQYDPRFEVIVVDGPSDDNTDAVVQKWRSRIKYAKNNARNLSVSRNIGIRLAAGEIVAFIDDDAIPFNDWVGTLLSEYNSVPRLVAGVGGITYKAGSLEFQADDILIDAYGRGDVNPARTENLRTDRFRTFLGTNCSFRQAALVEIGGFDEEYDYFLDESDVCLRILAKGYKLVHSRDLFLRHEVAESPNRIDKYRYNWYSIAKNTAYFALRFSSESPEDIVFRVRDQLEADRIAHLRRGFSAGLISQWELDRMSADVWRGMDQGIRDAKENRRLLSDSEPSRPFCPYLHRARAFAPLHVVLVTKEFPPFTTSGGVGTLYYHLASELLLMGHRVSVIAQGSENDIHHRGRFTLYRMPLSRNVNFGTDSSIAENNLNWSLCVATKIIEIDSRQAVSVVDGSIWDTELYACAVYRSRLRMPVLVRLVTPFAVACESNNWPVAEFERQLIMELERGLIAMSDCVIPISRSIEETIIERYELVRDERWRRVSAGISYWPTYEPVYDLDQGYRDLTRWPEIAAARENGIFIFLFLSRLEIRKGVDILLAAIPQVINRGERDCLFVLVGKDCMGLDTYLRGDERRMLKEHLLTLGEVSIADRERLYNTSDAVIFPSRYESFGLVPLEAFVHGKPVIGSNVGAIPEVVEDNESGLLYEDGNATALADCCSRLATDQELYRRLAEGAKRRVRKLSSMRMAKETEIVYRSILGLTGEQTAAGEWEDK
jgi:glycosyltransferase involved in cell wall biosynthesis